MLRRCKRTSSKRRGRRAETKIGDREAKLASAAPPSAPACETAGRRPTLTVRQGVPANRRLRAFVIGRGLASKAIAHSPSARRPLGAHGPSPSRARRKRADACGSLLLIGGLHGNLSDAAP